MVFSAITKTLNCEILTKNLLTFKKWDVLRKKDLNIKGITDF